MVFMRQEGWLPVLKIQFVFFHLYQGCELFSASLLKIYPESLTAFCQENNLRGPIMSLKKNAQQTRSSQRDNLLLRYRVSRDDPDSLMEAPFVPEALPPDNLLPDTVVKSGATVNIPEWGRRLDGDVLTVFFDGEAVETHEFAADYTDFPYQFTLDAKHLGVTGTYTLDYSVTADSGSSNQSYPTQVIVNLVAPPNNGVPAAIIFPPEVMDSALTLEYLESHGNQVTATIPSYANIEAGDKVSLYWETLLVEELYITAAHVLGDAIEISIPESIVVSTNDGNKQAHYYLTSRAGIIGTRSYDTSVEVLLAGLPDSLQEPNVPLAEDGTIDLADANNLVIVEIPEYGNPQAADSITVLWGGQIAGSAILLSVDNFPVVVTIPRSIILTANSGDISVSYVVTRGTRTTPSPAITVSVNVDTIGPLDPDTGTPVNEALSELDIIGLSDNALINNLVEQDIDFDAWATVPYYAEAAAGHVIKIYWGNNPNASPVAQYVVVQEDVDNAVFPKIVIPNAVVKSTPDGLLPVYYTLSADAESGSNSTLSPPRYVTVDMSVPGGPTGLAEPLYPDDADQNDWLIAAEITEGVNVEVVPYENMQLGDTITLTWQSCSTTNAASGSEIAEASYISDPLTVTSTQIASGAFFLVPYTVVEPIAVESETKQGAGRVKYTITQGSQAYDSPDSIIRVDMSNPGGGLF